MAGDHGLGDQGDVVVKPFAHGRKKVVKDVAHGQNRGACVDRACGTWQCPDFTAQMAVPFQQGNGYAADSKPEARGETRDAGADHKGARAVGSDGRGGHMHDRIIDSSL